MLYLDVAATTQPSFTAMMKFKEISERNWMNPSSKTYSSSAATALSDARKTIAGIIGAEPEQIFFTSGATEAANWVMAQPWDRIIISAIEHPCVDEAAFMPYRIPVDRNGVIDLDRLRQQLEAFKDEERVLVAVMGANNEIGTVEPIFEIARIVHSYPNARLFADNTQLWAHGDTPRLDGVDFACASAHKFGGFKGTGFLYVKEPDDLSPLLYGGHQERGLRAGTENVAGIVAMAAAFEENVRYGDPEAVNVRKYIDRLAHEAGYIINAEGYGLPNIASITLPDCGALEMIVALAMDGIYVSAGSACTSGSAAPSRILKAIGLTDEEALRTIRVSFDRKTRMEDIDMLFEKIKYYREMLP